MNSGLKRIEATLDQLQGHYPDVDAPKNDRRLSNIPNRTPNSTTPLPAAAKSIQPFPLPKPSAATQAPPMTSSQPTPRGTTKEPAKSKKLAKSAKAAQSTHPPSSSASPQRMPAASLQAASKVPVTIPSLTASASKNQPSSFSPPRQATNPNLALGLLKEVESRVIEWQLELEQTVLEIQALYLEGPIVDGWLESHPSGSQQAMQPLGAAVLRHAEIDRLMDYVEEICRVPQTLEPGEFRTGYCLCGLDADGQLWSRPCPPQQVPYVGLAIARYQKLRILLARKQGLEQRLTQLVQDLTMVHGRMQEPI